MPRTPQPDWWTQVVKNQSATIGPKWTTEMVPAALDRPLGKSGTATGCYALAGVLGTSASRPGAPEELSARKG
jgi:hypothetical protein